MKKKKVDKILKGVVTAGVALGGASFMSEADMVYATEAEDEVKPEEKADELELQDAESSEVLSETLDANASDANGAALSASVANASVANAPVENAPAAPENATVEDATVENAPAATEDAPVVDAPAAPENAPVVDAPAATEDAPAAEEASENKVNKETKALNEKKVAEKAPAEVPASAKAEVPAGGETPAAETPAEESSTETVQSPVTNAAYDKAVNTVIVDHQNIQEMTKLNDWKVLRQYVQDYVVADLTSKGATGVEMTLNWENRIAGERTIKLVYRDADGAFKTEYVRYKALDANGKPTESISKSIVIMQSNVVEDEAEGDLDIIGTNEIARVDIANKPADSLKTDFDNQLQETVANASEKPEDAFSKAIDKLNEAMYDVSKDKSWENWRKVTYAYADALIISNGGTVEKHEEWVTKNNAQDMHYGEIKYVDKAGEEKSVFYDYVCLTNKGVVQTEDETGKIVIVEKTPIYDGNGKVVGFASYEETDEDTNKVPEEIQGYQEAINDIKKGRGVVKLSTITSDLLENTIKTLTEAWEKNKPAPQEDNSGTGDTQDIGGGEQDGPITPGENPGVEPGTGEQDGPITPGENPGVEPGTGENGGEQDGPGTGENVEPGTGGTNGPAGGTTQPGTGTSDTTDTTDDGETQAQEAVQITGQRTTQAEGPAQQVTTINNNTVPAGDTAANDGSTNGTPVAENGQDNAEAGGAGEAQDQETTSLDEGQVPLSVGKTDVVDNNSVKIEENDLPQSANPAVDGKISWWWLLIILLFGAAGKKWYDEHQKKVAANAEANNQDK